MGQVRSGRPGSDNCDSHFEILPQKNFGRE